MNSKALIEVAGKYRLVSLTAVLTGIRHGELKRLCWGDFNLSPEKPSVVVRASISKNHKQACLPLYPALAVELSRFRPANAVAGDLVFAGMVPRSEAFNLLLKKAGIAKVDSQGRVVDFHSLRHTFCTNLHRAGVPQREAMELMRHNDPRLTANTYADASLFSLRSAVEKLPWDGGDDDAQRDAQRNDFAGHSASLAVTVEGGMKSEKAPINMGLKSLSVAVCPATAKTEEWLQRQGSNLQHHG
jgi:integrase